VLFALALHTGRIRWRRGVDLPGPIPSAMQQRGALAITAGRVWVSFGAQFGDCSNYKGRVVGVSLDGTGDPVVYDPSTRRHGGIWNPAGPTVDAHGHLLVVSANGSSFPGDAYDHTNSVLELSSSGRLLDSFAPTNWAENNRGDVGLGSQGVALVGTQWAMLGGKSGPVYVLRHGHLGGIGGPGVGTRPERRDPARAQPGYRHNARAGSSRRDQSLRHTRALRQPGARAYPHRRRVRPYLLTSEQ
jgi:hypothetical protein